MNFDNLHMMRSMKRFRNKLKKSIVTRVSFANGLIFLAAFVLMMILILISESLFLIGRTKETMSVTAENTLNLMDNTMKDIGRVSLICFSDDHVQEIIRSYSGTDEREQISDARYLDNLYTSMIEIRGDIQGITITDNQKIIFHKDSQSSKNSKCDDLKYISELDEIEQNETNVAGCSIHVGNFHEYFNYKYGSLMNPFETNKLYLVRTIRSFQPYQEIGHIVLTTRVSHIRDIICQNLTDGFKEDAKYVFLDSEGAILCSSDGQGIGTYIGDSDNIYYALRNEVKNHNLIRYQNDLFYKVSADSDYSGCSFILVMPLSVIMRQLKIPLIFGILISVIFGSLTVLLSRKVTWNRLKELKAMADKLSAFDKNDLEWRYEVEVDDEIGQVERAVNSMLDYINDLLEKEYMNKIRLQRNRIIEQNLSMRYLKSQINPHFLYNTLDTIRIVAALNGDQKAADMLMQLVIFYRKGSKTDSQLIPLNEEIIMLTAYLNLMHYRYEGLHYLFDVPDEVKDVYLPNFVLQPLVENSLLHGFKNRGYRGNIHISGQMSGDNVQVIISDDGEGMDDDTFKELNDLPYEMQEGSLKGAEGRHIGIQNVKARLYMYYGTYGTLKFMRNEAGGCKVEVNFLVDPIQQLDVEDGKIRNKVKQNVRREDGSESTTGGGTCNDKNGS